MSGNQNHRWNFFRAGGFDQVKLQTGADILALDKLDQKLWVALSCPVRGLEIDAKTLQLIDADHDGRLRASDIITTAKWAGGLLKNPDILFKPLDRLTLDDIDDSTPEGLRLVASAKRILTSLGKPEAREIALEDTLDIARVFSQTNFNGDGILPAEAAEEPVRRVIGEIIDCLGSQVDRSGKPGIDRETADTFFTDCQTYITWWDDGAGRPEVMPLSDATAAAAAVLGALRGKIDDYFARCRLAAFDERAVAALNREEKEYLALAAKDLTITAEEIASLPLARIAADRALPLLAGVNPAWSETLTQLRRQVVEPLLGALSELTEGQWCDLKARFEPFRLWSETKPAVAVEKLGSARIREILAGGSQGAINDLIAKDKALDDEFNAIVSVELLLRLRRDLVKLLNNFVSFHDFYKNRGKASFQAGTLYLDQRSCDLCIRVTDLTKHISMSHLSSCYLLYCECTRHDSTEKMNIVAAMTDGESDALIVGRNGIFYDHQGRDWDATIVRIVENPISIRQAFWGPYKRLVRWIGEQVAKRAAAAETASSQKMQAAAAETAKTTVTGKAAAAAAPKQKFDVGVVAALGVAVGGITAALGAIMQSIFGLGLWMPLGFVGILLMISGPSMVIAWLKLRQRNLGPLLDANGWAINARVKINIPFGKALTGMPKLPGGAKRETVDPFAEKHGKRNFFLIVAVVAIVLGIVWYQGILDPLLPVWLQQTAFFGVKALPPAAIPPTP
ncbi:MAG TPA: hypothetical protein PK961_09815 [bacterium]|nr:hypothetical protein [bacterium]